MFNITNHQKNANRNHMGYHLTPIRMVPIKKKQNKTGNNWVRLWSNWNPCTLLVGMHNGVVTMKTVWSYLKKLKIELFMIQQSSS